jgi:ABC-type glutathione transport system ATPase component
MAAAPVVSVEDLRVRFTTPETVVHAVNGISFALEAGRVLGISANPDRARASPYAR